VAAVRSAYDDVVRLSELPTGLLTLAELQTEGIADAPQPVALNELVDRVLRDVNWEAELRDVRIETDVPDELVSVARVRLERSLTNLARNAIRHGPTHTDRGDLGTRERGCRPPGRAAARGA